MEAGELRITGIFSHKRTQRTQSEERGLAGRKEELQITKDKGEMGGRVENYELRIKN